jgi:HAD superfamily phosphatase
VSTREIIVFDMDGVLVDVRESYRETICQTVEHFTGRRITRELVQEYKNRGGFNNDWLLSHTITRDLGVEVAYEQVVDYFNEIFLGGLIQRERWIPSNGLLDELRRNYELAIFTGRERKEADITLQRFAVDIPFDPIITTDDVVNGKPHPEGLLKIAERRPNQPLWFVGDTVDDARSARAASVRFIGVGAEPELVRLFQREQAVAIVEDINQLPAVLS